MNTDDVEKLASACGEIARGFKKIRAVLLRTGTVEELPPPVPTVPTELVRTFVLQYEHEVDCEIYLGKRLRDKLLPHTVAKQNPRRPLREPVGNGERSVEVGLKALH